MAETKAQADDAAGRVPAGSKKRRRIVRAIVLAVVLLAGYGLFLVVDEASGWSSYRQGARRAREDLRAGLAGFISVRCDPTGELDEETGLTVYGTGYPGQGTFQFADGYNREVYRHIRKHGLPANSMKQWAPVLLDLPRYWKEQSAGSAPAVILPNAETADYRGWRLWLTTRQQAWIRGDGNQWFEDRFELHVSADGRSHVQQLDERDVQKVECYSGPAGSGFAVLRVITAKGPVLYALELRSGRWLPTRTATSPPFDWRDEE